MKLFGFQIHLKRLHINRNNLKQNISKSFYQYKHSVMHWKHLRGAHHVIFFTLYDQKTSVKQQQYKKRASVSGQMMTFKRIQQRRNNGGRDYFKHNWIHLPLNDGKRGFLKRRLSICQPFEQAINPYLIWPKPDSNTHTEQNMKVDTLACVNCNKTI